MNNYLSDDLKVIKSRYKYTIRDGFCAFNNDLNYSLFRWLLEDLKIEENLELLKMKIEKKVSNNFGEAKYISDKIFIDQIIYEFNAIKNEAKSRFNFSDSIIRQIESNYEKNKTKIGVLEIYRKACKDIMQNSIECYIKYEKKLILLLDKLKDKNFELA